MKKEVRKLALCRGVPSALIKIKYYFSDGKPEAIIRLFLPTAEREAVNIHPALVDPYTTLLGEELNYQWGVFVLTHKKAPIDARQKEIILEGESWEELKEKVHEKVEEIVTTLKRVIQKNSTPDDEEIEIQFS